MLLNAPDTRRYDGHFVDARARTIAPKDVADPRELEAVGEPTDEVAFFVNGISSDIGRTHCDMSKLGSLGYRVVGVHNGTAGMLRDLGQCVADKLNLGRNGAVDTVKSLLSTSLATGQALTLIGHSQGALICSRALWETQKELRSQGLSPEETADKLSQVTLHTAGGAAFTFPAGPEYHHRVNLLDPVAVLTGLATGFPGTSKGQNATVESFWRFDNPLESAPPCPHAGIPPKLLDRTVHGVSVYYQ